MKIFIVWKQHLELGKGAYTATWEKIDNCLDSANESLAMMIDQVSKPLKKKFILWFEKNRPGYAIENVLKHCKSKI